MRKNSYGNVGLSVFHGNDFGMFLVSSLETLTFSRGRARSLLVVVEADVGGLAVLVAHLPTLFVDYHGDVQTFLCGVVEVEIDV